MACRTSGRSVPVQGYNYLVQGPPGKDGKDGAQGLQGVPGPQGPPGADGGGGGGSSAGLSFHQKVISGGDIGALRVQMTLPALTAPPSYVGSPVVLKGSTGDDDVTVLSIDTVSSTSYFVNLSAPAISGQTILNSYIPTVSASYSYHNHVITAPEAGATTIAMLFPVVLGGLPSYLGHPVVIKSSSGQDDITVLTIDSLTVNGYNANLSGPAIAGQIISNIFAS